MSMSCWKSRIDFEYRKIQQSRNEEIRKAWRENWKVNTEHAHITYQEEIKWPSISMEKGDGKRIYMLEPIKPLPPMSNWVLSPTNYQSESENQLLNLPFITEENTSKTFLRDLVKSYGGKVSGNKWNGKEFGMPCDEIFVELMEALKAYIPLQEYNFFPNPIIFQAMSEYFSKRATPEQLKEKYDQLLDEKQPKDDEQVSALNAFRKHFCCRCYRYGCELHRKTEDSTSRKTQRIETRSGIRLKTPVEPCGPNCYKFLQSQSQTSESVEAARSSELNGLGTLLDWSDDEKILFQALYRIFANKYCIIAQAMLFKRTCREVYEFAQKEHTPSNQTEALALTPVQASHRHRKISTFYHRQQKANGHGSSKQARNYSPCCHPEKQCTTNCSCVSVHNACEKYCHCSLACTNRFPGCTCRGQCNTKKCPCFIAVRECDPDLCQNCGAAKYDLGEVECKNVSIQRGLKKHLLLAPSDVAGWGIFLKNGAKRNDFISEYCGEIITQEEADRRGRVYDMQKSSFLFELNKDYVIDATYSGSKIRFANHSINPNCYAKVMMVLGNHRIGIFAKRDISPGEELFFDYRYGLTEILKFVSIEREMEIL